LRVAIERIQDREQLHPNDPALLRLKGSVVSNIAELELRGTMREQDSEAPPL
jgi:hypothetical protein